jgi:hypothetical protein
MISNHLKNDIRRLKPNKGYSFTTIAGRAGLGICAVILVFARAALADPVDALRQE